GANRASTPSSAARRPPPTRSRAARTRADAPAVVGSCGRGAVALPPLDRFLPVRDLGARTPMRKLLLQLDSSRLPSVFDRVVAYDGGADEVMSYGGIAESDVRDLIHGCIFTRGPKDLKNTAVFVGGAGARPRAQAVRWEGACHRDAGRERGDPRVRAGGAAAERRTRGGDAGPEASMGESVGAEGRRGRERGSAARRRGGRGDGRRR